MSNKAAWVSLICGILAFLLVPIGPFLAVIAIIAGFIGRKKKQARTVATIGLVLGIVWWVIAILAFVLVSVLGLLGSIVL
ncbi:MAG: hypothetical protein JXA22_01475 [Candidatus Thermoplasmatota archaeon]|nr:hypothetical protein [Candidatus Thermoplasmatota archaeon]